MTDGYPEVPEEMLDGWQERVRSASTVFQIPTASVIGRTILYEDPALRDAVATAGFDDLLDGEADDDGMVDSGKDNGYWRFFFATALAFRPPLPAGIGPVSVRPTVVAEARRVFQRDLESRGFENVERGQRQRVRTDSGERATLVKYTARFPAEDAPINELAIEGWHAVWSTDGSFRIVGGAYPIRGLEELLGDTETVTQPNTDPNAYREELLALLRAVE